MNDLIISAEGYATARSIAEATGLYTIAAMSSININPATPGIAQLLQNSKVIIVTEKSHSVQIILLTLAK